MTLYGFFWTDCVYESGPILQSLHRSKMDALRAMIRAQATRWESCRSGMSSGIHLGGLGTFKWRYYRKDRESQDFAVRAVDVLP